MHSGKKPNKCNQINYALFNAGDLRKHLKMHCGEKSNNCNRCDYILSDVPFEDTFDNTQWQKAKIQSL